jgi:hypothetical protein
MAPAAPRFFARVRAPPRRGRIARRDRQAVVAQLAEQLIRNQQVAGSNPANGSSRINKIAAPRGPSRLFQVHCSNADSNPA